MYDADPVPTRRDQMIETLIGEHRALYVACAPYRFRIDTLAQTFLQIAEDAAVAAQGEDAEMRRAMQAAERDSHPVMLLTGDGDVQIVCGDLSPALSIEGGHREACVLEPHHRGPHRGKSGFYAGGDPMSWTSAKQGDSE